LESLVFLLNSIAVIVLVVMGLRDDRRKPGAPAKSYFRYIEEGDEGPDHIRARPGHAARAADSRQGSKL
jgi:hypothetical protein